VNKVTCCCLCGDEDKPLKRIYGDWYCDECEEFDRTCDIDAYEEQKRARIAEENEY